MLTTFRAFYLRTILLSIILLPSCILAQESFDITNASLYYPHRYKPKELKMEAALSQVKIPFDWVEQAVQAPLFHFHANYGLPKNFSIDGRFSTLIISNQISLGPRWNYQKDKFSLNLGYDLAFAFGFLNQFGFNTSVTTWTNIPNLSVGYRIGEIAFTLKGEVSVITAFTSKQGENVVESDRNVNNGYTIGLYMEQRVSKNKVLVLGLKNSYAKYHFIGWAAFFNFQPLL